MMRFMKMGIQEQCISAAWFLDPTIPALLRPMMGGGFKLKDGDVLGKFKAPNGTPRFYFLRQR